MTTRTRVHSFGGFNINDKRVMSRREVESDLRTLRRRCDVAVVCEFRWRVYWGVMLNLFRGRGPLREWASFPPAASGLARSTWAAQVVLWDKRYFRRKDSKRAVLHKGFAKISEARSIRATLLTIEGLLDCWFGVTHFVVSGDNALDPDRRNDILLTDITRTADFWDMLIVPGGPPVVFQLDANIRPGTWGYDQFRRRIEKHDGRIVGGHGIEYLLIFDAHTDVKVKVTEVFEVRGLNTPHEGRCMKFYLERR